MSSGRLVARLTAAARQRPDNPAITFLDGRLQARPYSFRALFQHADKIASAMSRQGITEGATVGVLLGTQEAQVLHYLAALRVGAVPAILTPPNRKLNREYYALTTEAVLDRSNFAAVVTDLELPIARGFAPFSLEPHRGTDAASVRTDAGGAEALGSFLQFTSGTTGIKRAVVVSDDAVLAQLDVYGRALALSERDAIVSWLPLYHDMGFIACLNLPLAHGVHTVMLDPIDWVSDPALFLRAASAHRATLAWNPNFAYAFMSERARDGDLTGIDLRPLRGLVNCSEPVTFESQRRFLDRFAPLGARDDAFCGCYAMAETTFALTHGSARDAQYVDDRGPDGAVAGVRKYVSTGRPLEGVDIAIMNAGSRAGDRRLGEIWVRSPFTFSRYYDDAAETERAFVDGWYRTGDVGYMADGNLYVTGRKKDVMIVAGVNVYPQDVEALVSIVEGVRPGRVSSFSRFDERQQTEHITVLAESDLTGAEADSAVLAIRQRLLAGLQIANFSVHLVPPQWLVKSSSGKMAHRENRKKWELRQGSASRSQSSVEAS